MFNNILIDNFRSIKELDITLNRVNIFIGENGSGKSNFLKALAFLSVGLAGELANKADKKTLKEIGVESYESILTMSERHKPFRSRSTEVMVTDEGEQGLPRRVYLPLQSTTHKTQLTVSSASTVFNTSIGYKIFDPDDYVSKRSDRRKLLKKIRAMMKDTYTTPIDDLNDSLGQLGWYPHTSEFSSDEYISDGLMSLLFCIVAIVSKDSPSKIAIDNIDRYIDTKRCGALIPIITKLAIKYDKQIFVTVTNASILNGVDINSSDEKLFIVSRNKEGYTRMKEVTIDDLPKSADGESIWLSEGYSYGWLGGLPKSF